MEPANHEGMQGGEGFDVHAYLINLKRVDCNPLKVYWLDDHLLMASKKPMREVIAANVLMLMQASEVNTNAKLAAKTGLGLGTIDRVRRDVTNPQTDTLEAIAAVYKVEPWMLLIDGWTPGNPPVARGRTETERQLYEQLEKLLATVKAADTAR